MEFNKKHYRKLLKLKQEFESGGQILDFNYTEFWHYSAKMEDRIYLELLDSYLNLSKKFLEGEMSKGELFFEYIKLQRYHEKIQDELESNLIILSPQDEKKLYRVSDLLENLFWILEETPGDTQEQVREQFFNTVIESKSFEEETIDDIKKIYIKLKNIFKNYRKNAKISSNFAELTDQLNWENQDHYIELIEAFLDDSSDFLKVKERYESILKVAKELDSNLISFKLNYQSLGFSNYLFILIQLFDNYQMNSTLSLSVFKYWVRKILFEIKNHYS